jgi:ribonuclease P protein component
MLSMKNRFHGHTSVRRVYRLGKSTRTGLASMHSLSNEKIHTSKLAIVVSRKVDKSAVRRNRIRRRIFALARPLMAELKQPTELVITVYQSEASAMPTDQLADAVDELFKKAKL